MKNKTTEFSFILKPSTIDDGGVGVFAIHAIAKDTFMELFLDGFREEIYKKDDIPGELQGYCLDQDGGKILRPKFFNSLDIGNYLNHSSTNQNLRYESGRGYFAMRDIQAGEELLVNYTELGEPEDTWEDYYTRD